MKLVEEAYKGVEYEHYTKKYNDVGMIVYEKSGYNGNNIESIFHYDDKNRLTKILETHSSQTAEYKIEKIYEYDGENYRITELLKFTRDNSDINTYENLVLGKEKWHKKDEMQSVHEYKISNGKIISERYIDLAFGHNRSVKSTYDSNGILKQIEATRVYTDREETIIEKYQNGLVMECERFIDGKIVSVTVTSYHDEINLVQSKSIYRFFEEERYLAFENNYYYDSSKRLTKIEYYGLYDNEMVCINIEENVYHQNKTVSKISGYGTDDFGFYNIDEVRLFYEQFYETDNEKAEFLQRWESTKYEPKSQKVEFTIVKEEIYDTKRDLVQKVSRNAKNLSEVYSNLFYHYEYNKVGLLETELGFNLENQFEIEHMYTKKLFYA